MGEHDERSGESANLDVDMMRVPLQIFSEASAEWNVFFEKSKRTCTNNFIDAGLIVLMP